MRIAQVSPLAERVPPVGYGGTERIVAYLSDELVRQGHELTLFASGDSRTDGRLIAGCEQALRDNPAIVDGLAHSIYQLEQVTQHSGAFDIIHFHTGYAHFPFSHSLKASTLTTFHGRIDLPDLRSLFHQFRQLPVVSISDAQRSPFPNMNWQGTVYHGLPLDLFTPGDGSGNYLAFLGRISPEKRVDRAIEIARRAKMKLKIAAKIDAVDREYFEQNVARGLDSPHVEFIGECNGAAKERFLGDAYALLFPIDWPEPFGLVMIEAAACGTPVIAYRAGSVPEVVESGVTGFIVDSIEEAVRALDQVPSIDRLRCRQVFEERFSSARMAADYTRIYEQLAGVQQRPHKAAIQQGPQVSLNGAGKGEKKEPPSEEGACRDKKAPQKQNQQLWNTKEPQKYN